MQTTSQESSWAGIEFLQSNKLDLSSANSLGNIEFHATGWQGLLERGHSS